MAKAEHRKIGGMTIKYLISRQLRAYGQDSNSFAVWSLFASLLPFPVFLAPRVPRPNVFWLATCGALARAPGFFRQRLRVLASNPIETSTWGGPETGPRRGSWRSSTKRRCECGDVLPGLESGDLASLASGSPGLGAVCGRAGGAVLNCTPRPNAVVLWSIQTDSVPPN